MRIGIIGTRKDIANYIVKYFSLHNINYRKLCLNR